MIFVVLLISLAFSQINNFFSFGDGSVSSYNDEATCWNYKRLADSYLANVEAITDFTSIEMTVFSEKDMQLVTFITDIHSNEYVKIVTLTAGEISSISMKPEDFTNTKGVDPMNSKDCRTFSLFMDILSISGPSEDTNQLCVYNNFTLEFADLDVRDEDIYILNQTLSIPSSMKINGDLYVYNSELNISASRFEVTGNIWVVNSAFSIEGGSWVFHESYNHEHSIYAGQDTTFSMFDGTLFLCYPFTFLGHYDSIVHMKNVTSLTGSWTYSLITPETAGQKGGELYLQDVTEFGEIIVNADTILEIDGETSTVLIWISTKETIMGNNLEFPSTEEPGFFNSSSFEGLENAGFSIHSSESTENIFFGLILEEGADLTIQNSSLRAVGFNFIENGVDNKMDGLRNGESYTHKIVESPSHSMRLELLDTSVESWNYYTANEATLEITDSLFGEVIAFGDSIMTIKNSMCDGTGGYFSTDNNGKVYASYSNFSSLIICRKKSYMRFEFCIIDGDIVLEDGEIVLKNSTFNGNLIRNGNGTFIIDPIEPINPSFSIKNAFSYSIITIVVFLFILF